jgi:hypothetical protein
MSTTFRENRRGILLQSLPLLRLQSLPLLRLQSLPLLPLSSTHPQLFLTAGAKKWIRQAISIL